MERKKSMEKADKTPKAVKTGNDIKKHFGILKGDKEYDKIQKELKKGWNRFTKRILDQK